MATQPVSIEDFIAQLNDEPSETFSELANHFDIWAARLGQTRQQTIEYVTAKTGRSSTQEMDTQPVQTDELVEFPVVIFSPRKEQ